MTNRSPISGEEQDIKIALSPEGLVTALTFHYAVLRDHGAPCAVYLNGNPARAEEFHDLMRRIDGVINTPGNNHTLCSGMGDEPSAGFDKFRPASFLPTGLGFIDILQGQNAISQPDAERAEQELSAAMARVNQTAQPVYAGGSQFAHLIPGSP